MLPTSLRSSKVLSLPFLRSLCCNEWITVLCALLIYRAREALKTCLPDPLRNASFATVLKDDTSTKRCLAQLLFNLSDQMGASGDT